MQKGHDKLCHPERSEGSLARPEIKPNESEDRLWEAAPSGDWLPHRDLIGAESA